MEENRSTRHFAWAAPLKLLCGHVSFAIFVHVVRGENKYVLYKNLTLIFAVRARAPDFIKCVVIR